MDDTGFAKGTVPGQTARPSRVPAFQIPSDDLIPNNRLPLLVYRHAFDLAGPGDPAIVERTFRANRWADCWRAGIYSYHHDHTEF